MDQSALYVFVRVITLPITLLSLFCGDMNVVAAKKALAISQAGGSSVLKVFKIIQNHYQYEGKRVQDTYVLLEKWDGIAVDRLRAGALSLESLRVVSEAFVKIADQAQYFYCGSDFKAVKVSSDGMVKLTSFDGFGRADGWYSRLGIYKSLDALFTQLVALLPQEKQEGKRALLGTIFSLRKSIRDHLKDGFKELEAIYKDVFTEELLKSVLKQLQSIFRIYRDEGISA